MDSFDYINDPVAAEQVATLRELLKEAWTDKSRDGFLVTAGRFIDEMGHDRTGELQLLFRTETAAGREALRASLETLFDFVGSLDRFETDYPIYINDPVHGSVGAFPQVPIIGIHALHTALYRLFDSKGAVYGSLSRELVRDYIVRTGRLPLIPPQPGLVLRQKPRMYWCSVERYDTLAASRAALQILAKWNSDCRLRATIPTIGLEERAFVAYSGVTEYPPDATIAPGAGHAFAGYNVELKATDHPELPGGGLQVGLVDEPRVSVLEEWRDDQGAWATIWTAAT